MAEEANGRAGIREVYAIVARVEEKIDKQLEDLERRVGRLERWRAYFAGAGAVIALGLGVLARVVVR